MRVVVAEKPSVARDLARVLGAKQKRDGYFAGRELAITWAFGHLVSLQEPEDYDPRYKSWRLEHLPIIPEQFQLKLTGDSRARQQFAVIKKLLAGADEIVCATDAGREGELIFRYILQLCGLAARPFKRLWLSSLTDSAIRDGFRQLRPGKQYDALYAAARGRSQADWIVGLNATRNYTVRFGRGRLWSVGRVQTPVLAMIAARDDEIRRFQPEAFWEVFTVYRGATFKYRRTQPAGQEQADRFAREQDARALLARISGQPLTVTDVKRKRERQPPPYLYDLTALQRDMNRRYRLSAAQTLKAAQSLYEDKLITYPRTDSAFLTADMKATLPGVLEQLRSQQAAAIAKLDLKRLRFSARIINDSKVSDHHAIIPTGRAPGNLSRPEQQVYEAIVRRFIAVFYPDCEKDVTLVDAEVVGEAFRARGVIVVEPGWTALYPKPKPKPGSPQQEEQTLPEFVVGEHGPHRPEVREGVTKPPNHYTENTLLAAMETAGRQVQDDALRQAMREKGLGTPATRAAIIETLLSREYIVRADKNLRATEVGRHLINMLRSPQLKSPELTGEWEHRLKRIEQGQEPLADFSREIEDFIREVVDASSTGHLDNSVLGPCPRCGRQVIRGRQDYGCSGWREGCGFVLRRRLQDVELSDEQVRELLQLRTLRRPLTVAGDDHLVSLDDTGELLLIPAADGRAGAQRAPGKQTAPRARKRRASPTKPRRAGAATASTRTRATSSTAPRATPAAAKSATAIGPCPGCGAPVLATAKAYLCSRRAAGCDFGFARQIAGKTISTRTARTLLEKGSTSLLTGFKSKTGKAFSATLHLEHGRVNFRFPAQGGPNKE